MASNQKKTRNASVIKEGVVKKVLAKNRKKNEDESAQYYDSRNRSLMKPSNQETLNEQQLKEEFIRNLTTLDPTKQKNVAVWDFNEEAFVPHVDNEHFVTLFSKPSELFDRNSEEIKDITVELIDDVSDNEEDEEKRAREAKAKATTPDHEMSKVEDKKDKLKDEGAHAGEGEEGEEKEEAQSTGVAVPKGKLLNQFNFCQRGSQTYNNLMRDHFVQTETPVRSQYKNTCNQFMIYDTYEEDKQNRPNIVGAKRKEGSGEQEEHTGEHEEQGAGEQDKETKVEDATKSSRKPDKDQKVAEKERVKIRKQTIIEGQAAIDLSLLRAVDGLRFMERLIATNVYDDVIEDFRYFEDAADEYRDSGEGTLLPLWRFTYDKVKRMHVTSISWSVSQPDMFAVTFGSFNFVNPLQHGMVVIYTLRNPCFPEFSWIASKGAMCCHIHPLRNCLVAVGLYDGNVAILNLEKNEENVSRSQILKNIPTSMKHQAPVWSVKWGIDDIDGNPTFYSAGIDGKIILWVVGVPDIQGIGGLDGSEIATLFLPTEPVSGPDGTSYRLFGCARVLCFHPKEKNLFLVGTAEGKIFQCSALYASRFQQIYNAHFLPVSALQWNHFHDQVFISASEDWTIKIWDQRESNPVYVFEIGIAVLDVCWAPYSSTVFACCTDEGKILVYDINVNKEKPICCQQVVTKKKVHPHRIQFNPNYPIVVVGDDRGHLIALKLSPNLRILPKDTRNILLDGEPRINFEINKMSKLLSLVRDPDSVTNPKNIPGPKHHVHKIMNGHGETK